MMDMQVDGNTWNKGFGRRHDVQLAHQHKRQKLLESGLLFYTRANKRQHFSQLK